MRQESKSQLSPGSAWHTLAPDAVAEKLKTDGVRGLTGLVVGNRQLVYGSNRLTGLPPRHPWLLLMDQFKGFLILVLLGAALLAAAVGDVKDALVILFVIVLNALPGTRAH